MDLSASRQAFESDYRLDAAQLAAIDVLTTPHRVGPWGGAYLWGPVGRGKTWLLDRYFDSVDSRAKTRVHFHSFFRDLHASYFRHGFSLEGAIGELLGEIDLLCFDEFHVHDVADGRLVSRVLDALFARKISLVTTSNYPPDGLLPNPLFHETFVPTIELLKSKLQVVRVDGPVDYRTVENHHAEKSRVSDFSRGTWTQERPGRGATFSELCDAPKSTGDYLAMIDKHDIDAVTDIPPFSDTNRDAVQRFSNLVDVLYDRDVRMVFHSPAQLSAVAAGCTGLDIERILSRLSQLRGARP
ncbi:cell division protein ZapE [Rhodococcus sp. G-MC3]|uniref:cell division protein ZapE n=1 Tax=Rhodococcus sp. G-MC3 TaxID=3046209 RepID=UPI0024BAC9EA|nr:cell division protein ZapE [Rhodococcus sp. G-MC3]MDJ0393782.1 cell division protein ZapE [Rhodococcus sp. G-MC3]